MTWVSSLSSAPVSWDLPSPRAAQISARLVILFETWWADTGVDRAARVDGYRVMHDGVWS